MLKLSKKDYENIENLIYARARDLEIALFQYYLNDEDKEMALHALTIYQNRDGGFGHGLEADSLNPNSSGIQTDYALNIIKSLGYDSSNLDEVAEYVVYRALHYIFRYAADEEGYISATIPSNNDFPCASWWKHNEDSIKNEWGYNPTASLYSHALWLTSPAHKYYKKTLKYLPKCLEHYFESNDINGHELVCYLHLLDVMKKKNIMPEILNRFEDKINKDIDRLIISDLDKWGNQYSGSCYPVELLIYDYLVNSEERKQMIDKNLDYLITSREDGLWDISWNWHNDYQEFELQRIKWRGVISVNNLAILKKYNRIEKTIS